MARSEVVRAVTLVAGAVLGVLIAGCTESGDGTDRAPTPAAPPVSASEAVVPAPEDEVAASPEPVPGLYDLQRIDSDEGAGVVAIHPFRNMRAELRPDAVVVSAREPVAGSWSEDVALVGVGWGGHVKPPAPASPEVSGDHAEFGHGPVTERYRHGPEGLVQGFIVGERSEGQSGPLVLVLSGQGPLRPSLSEAGITADLLDEYGRPLVHIRELRARDSTGRDLVARLQVEDDHVRLVVDDTDAVYPVEVGTVISTGEARLPLPDDPDGAGFGYAVAISGDRAVVGAVWASVDGQEDRGAAFIFRSGDAGWVPEARLVAPDGASGDWFGRSVAIQGDVVVVSAPCADVAGVRDQGVVYVFVRGEGGWALDARLASRTGAQDDYFGRSVAIDGDRVVVGANGVNIRDRYNQGAAYVFTRRATVWSEEATLLAPDGNAADEFGYAVAILDARILVGTYGSRAAYVFLRGDGGWTQEAKLTAPDGVARDRWFGWSVALSGDRAVVGTPGADVGENYSQGAVYVFVRGETGWTFDAKLTAPDGATNDELGSSVAVSGDRVLAGSAAADEYGRTNQGAVHLFLRTDTGWRHVVRVTAADGARWDDFGSSVAISDDLILIGAHEADSGARHDTGAAYLYSLGGAIRPLPGSTAVE